MNNSVGRVIHTSVGMWCSGSTRKDTPSSFLRDRAARLRVCMTFLISIAIFFSLGVREGKGDKGFEKSVAVSQKNITWEANDPIFMGGGVFRETWNVMDLGGPMGLNFLLQYYPDLKGATPFFSGRSLFPPWENKGAFSGNVSIFVTHWEDQSQTGNPNYVNVFLGNITVVFTEDGAGGFKVDDMTAYRVTKDGNYYYMMDPVRELVYIFTARERNIQIGESLVRWSGELTYLVDRNGNTLTFQYNSDYNPTSIQDNFGRTMSLIYVEATLGRNRNLSRIADGQGRTVNFTYTDTTCNGVETKVLSSFTDAVGDTTDLEYYEPESTDGCNLVKKIIQPEGNARTEQTWTTNPRGGDAIHTQTDAYGNRIAITYSQSGDQTIATLTHPDNTQRVLDHIDERFPKKLTDETGKSFSDDYDNNHRLTKVTDRLGATTNLTYHSESGKVSSFTNANGNTKTFSYTAQTQTFTNPANSQTFTFTFYNLTRISYPDNTNEQFTYDANGNALTKVDRAGKTWTFTYNSTGQILTASNPAGGVTTYTYNTDATLATSTNSDTGTATYSYDTYRRLTKTTHPNNTTVQIAYDLNDRVTSIIDENSRTYTYTYDTNGNLTVVTDPASNTARYAYDLMDRVSSVTDRLGKTATRTYDTFGRLASATDPNAITRSYGYDSRGWFNSYTLGGAAWQTGYDDEGVPSSNTTPLGFKTDYQTDNLGHLSAVTDPLSKTTTLTRNSMTRITEITDPLNRTTQYSYENRGLLSGVTLPGGTASSYTRNDLGALSGITDLNDQDWGFGYTAMGRPSSATDSLGNTQSLTYDTLGRPSQTAFPGSETLTRTYDNAGNLIRNLYSGGTDLQFTYDSLNRLITANNLTLTRDAEGRVTNTQNATTGFGAIYDDGGRLKTATYNNEVFTVTYTYDTTTGLLSRVTDDLTGAQVDLSFDTDRRATGITRSNGVNATFTWDNADRLTRIQEGSIIDIIYTLDSAGQVTKAEMTVPLDPASLLSDSAETFTYDAASQVSTTGYTYDKRGRRTASNGTAYTWDGASRLTGAGSASLAYNGLGNLATRTHRKTTTRFYYNYGIGLTPIVAEKNDTTGEFLRYYVWTPGGSLLYMIDAANGNKVYFYHFDRTGSTLALTDSSGTVTDVYAYTPFGKLLGHEGSSNQPFTFVGRWGVRLEGVGGSLYHMRARYYDAVTAGFISREPIWPQIADPMEVNPYQYALATPVNRGDPTGLSGPVFNFLWHFSEDTAEFEEEVPVRSIGSSSNRPVVDGPWAFKPPNKSKMYRTYVNKMMDNELSSLKTIIGGAWRIDYVLNTRDHISAPVFDDLHRFNLDNEEFGQIMGYDSQINAFWALVYHNRQAENYTKIIRDLEKNAKGAEDAYKMLILKEVAERMRILLYKAKENCDIAQAHLPRYAKDFKKMWRRSFLQPWEGYRKAVRKSPIQQYLGQSTPSIISFAGK